MNDFELTGPNLYYTLEALWPQDKLLTLSFYIVG